MCLIAGSVPRTLATERPLRSPAPKAVESAYAPDKFPQSFSGISFPAGSRLASAPSEATSAPTGRAALFRADDIISNVYFPYTGIMSIIVGVSSGQFVEAGMLGRNSVVGTGAALDGPSALNTAIAQVESTG